MRSETKINKQHAPPLGQNTRGIMGRISPQPSDPTDNCDSSRVTGLEASEFEVKKLIGKGGFGKVYHVVQRSTGEEFALKVINKKRMEEKGTIQRVVSEIEIHLQLEHSSIVKLHDFFEDQTHIFMVLELCSSANLYKRLREAKHFTEDEARRYFIQIVEGLSYLHSHGIVHRDLKLSNLLLSRDGSIKIADFGLATRITEDNVDEQRTVCGTPNYAAPEVCGEIVSHESDKVIESTAKARPGYGVQADVWSLGCLLYSMLVGKPPFPKQQLRNLKPVSQLNFGLAFPSHLSSSARDIISALLQVVPAERPRSIDICEMFQFCGAKPKTLAISSTTSVQQNTFVSVPAKSSTGFRSLVSPSSSTKTLSPPSLDLPIISPGPFRNIQETFGHLVIQFLHDGSILSESKQTGLTMVISNNEGNDVSESNQVVRDMSEGTHHEITIQFHKCPNQCGGYADVVKPGAKRTGCSGCLRRFDCNQLPNKLLEFYLHTHKCAEALKASAPRVALELPEGVCTLRGSGSKQELHVHWNEPVWKRAKYKLFAGEIVVEEETGKCVYSCELGEVRWLSGLYTEEREQSVLKTVDTMAEIAFHCVTVLVDYEKTIIDLIASGKANSIPLPCVLRKENDSTIQDSTSTLSQASGTVVAPIDPFVRELVSEMTQTKLTCASSNQSNKDHTGQQLNGALRNGNLDVQSTKSENLSLQQVTPTTVHHIDTSLHQPSTEILHEECQHSKSEESEKQLEQHEVTDTETSEPKQVEVTGVGVGIQKSSGEVEVCLEDGTHVLVRLDGSCIVFQSSDEAKAEPIILMPFAKIPSSLLLTFKQTMLIVSDLRSALQ